MRKITATNYYNFGSNTSVDQRPARVGHLNQVIDTLNKLSPALSLSIGSSISGSTVGKFLIVGAGGTLDETSIIPGSYIAGAGLNLDVDEFSINYAKTANVYTGNGLVSSPLFKYTGTAYSGGTLTTTKPYILIEPTGTTSDTWNIAGTYYGINVPSGFLGNVFDFKNNAGALLYLSYNGTLNGVGWSATIGGIVTLVRIQFDDGLSTAIAKSSAGIISVGGVIVPTISSAHALTNKTYNGLTITANGTNILNLAAGSSLITVGAFVSTFTFTNTTAVTFPTSGTLLTTTGDGTGLSGIAKLATANTFSMNGAVSAPVVLYTGDWFAGGTVVTTKPFMLLRSLSYAFTESWSTFGTAFGILAIPSFTGNIFDFKIDSTQLLKLDYQGLLSGVSGIFSSNVTVLDDPYDATGWNGNVAVPTKNAIRDKIETMVLSIANASTRLSTSFVAPLNTPTEGTDNTAMDVLTIVLPANTLVRRGDRLKITFYVKGTTGTAIQTFSKLNGVTIDSPYVGGTDTIYAETYIDYVDPTHGSVFGITVASNTLEVAGFDWAVNQNIILSQAAVSSQHIAVYGLTVDLFPISV